MSTITRQRLIILGSGFAAFSLLKKIDLGAYDVTVISPRNHFVFTPLLPSTTIGTLEFRSIIEPIRRVRRGDSFIQAACTAIDTEHRTLTCHGTAHEGEFTIAYDLLVVTVGAWNNTFGVPGVREHAFFLKEVSEARAIRERVISNLEAAATPGTDYAEQRRLLHFVVVGGGPTGVEFAAELHDLIEEDLDKHYEGLRELTRITLFEAGSQILNTFDADLREFTLRHFRRNRIEVRLDSAVAAVGAESLSLKNNEEVPTALVVWSTGNGPTGLVQALPWKKDHSGRLLTDDCLQVLDHPGVYALGDCATPAGASLPQTSQCAMQEGKYLAKALNGAARGRAVPPFHFNNLGMLAYVGERRALADLKKAHMSLHGWLTYFFWRSAYLTRLVTLKNKVLVLFNWIATRLFGRDLSKF